MHPINTDQKIINYKVPSSLVSLGRYEACYRFRSLEFGKLNHPISQTVTVQHRALSFDETQQLAATGC